MASLTQWAWVWINSGSWWWTGRPGVLQSMGSQSIGHNWATELNWTDWDGHIKFVFFSLLISELIKPKNWCFWTIVLEKTLESPFDYKDLQPVHPKGNQSWIFIGRTDAEAETLILWPPDVKNWLVGKDPDAGKGGRRRDDRGWDGWMALVT